MAHICHSIGQVYSSGDRQNIFIYYCCRIARGEATPTRSVRRAESLDFILKFVSIFMLNKIELSRQLAHPPLRGIAVSLALSMLTLAAIRVNAEPTVPTPAGTPAPTVTPPSGTSATPTPNNAPSTPSPGKVGAPITTVSGKAEISLAEYLAANDAKFYGAYWCPACQKQKSLFGAKAAAKLPYVECDKDGANSQRQLCKDLNIKLFPTWIIKGKYYPEIQDLKELAKISGYKGSQKFKYPFKKPVNGGVK